MPEHPSDTTLVLASRNPKKSREISALLAPYGLKVVGVDQFANVPEVDEDRDSFIGNAQKKAAEVAQVVRRWTIAEDSGLCVDALNGAPGVYSARYAHEDRPDGESVDRQTQDSLNNAKLIRELSDIPRDRRTAKYICHVSVADPEGVVRLDVECACRGMIIDEPRGENGFGYDPYFSIPEYHRTFGELSGLVKNCLSHRSRAMQRLIPQLVALLAGERR
ncbi:RdgB/HAM1 family non-canonical purine NTP pyrophosphatase [Thalassoroseus pseudoceratinae]|uniref:RdgB/HAM1 family non-canonical purine NTP pyrophosphatase n=1 Tax=Thalassoroseus pseudoceratinae TaxID=2713176 RepID=UPI001420136E|nr:RdgB/HAM1 family non-canonical purine NTP pyrophosphatase [Thalassoroseus pseudoceratinae]